MHGDQYVQVTVEVPKNLSKRQKELLSELDSASDEKNYQKRKNFLVSSRTCLGIDPNMDGEGSGENRGLSLYTEFADLPEESVTFTKILVAYCIFCQSMLQ